MPAQGDKKYKKTHSDEGGGGFCLGTREKIKLDHEVIQYLPQAKAHAKSVGFFILKIYLCLHKEIGSIKKTHSDEGGGKYLSLLSFGKIFAFHLAVNILAGAMLL